MAADSFSVVFRDYRATDRQWVETANVHHYTVVEGFDASFAQAVASALDLLEASQHENTSRFLIVEGGEGGDPVGCVFLCVDTATAARLRLFYLSEACRGLGIGKRMLDQLIEHARLQGFDTLRVSTFDRHQSACRLYQAAGFQYTTQAPSMAFGQPMRQIDFEKDLRPRSP